jgi:hypothetical protein
LRVAQGFTPAATRAASIFPPAKHRRRTKFVNSEPKWAKSCHTCKFAGNSGMRKQTSQCQIVTNRCQTASNECQKCQIWHCRR